MKFKGWIVYVIKSICKIILRVLYICPVRQNRVLFCAYKGTKYACNPKYIYEKLISKYPGRFETVWVIDSPCQIPENHTCVKRNSLRYSYYMMTSKALVDNWGFNAFIPYRKSQLKINTWHGGGAYKKGGIDTDYTLPYRRQQKIDGKSTDILISSCQRFSKVFSLSHYISSDKIWEIGMPRNDMMLNNPGAKKDEFLNKIGVNLSNKLVIYAPTYRGDFLNASFEEVTFDFKQCIQALRERFGGEWVIGFRMHYAYNSQVNKIPGCINLSGYQDMQELLIAADVLITDYSSCMWDFSLTGKPCFIYANDLDQYIKDTDFYTPVSKWPFPIAEDNEQLIKNILTFDKVLYDEYVCRHHQDLGIKETGNATEIVADLIYDYCFNGLTKSNLIIKKY